MGGYGSGQGQDGKDTTSDMRALDVRRLQRESLLTPGHWFLWKWLRNGEKVASIQIKTETDRVILLYRCRSNRGEWQLMEYPVALEWTACNFGGRRVWFRCPETACGRRVAVLFGGSTFACRHCHRLVYESQQATDEDRAMRRADKLRQKLGWQAGIANLSGGKPKGMHWRTFARLSAEHDAIANALWAAIAERLALSNQ